MAACDRGEPLYYVDGARPSPGVNTARTPVPHDEYVEGCVPWSEDRPDVYVCGPVPEGWAPAPPPGTYADYGEVCDAAARVVDDQGATLMATYQLAAAPKADVESCGAAGIGSELEGRWLIRFGLANPQEVRPYRSASLFGFRPASEDPRSVIVRLSKRPWPT